MLRGSPATSMLTRVKRRRRKIILFSAAFAMVASTAAANGDYVGPAIIMSRGERVSAPLRSMTVAAVGDWLPEQLVTNAAARYASPGQRLNFTPLLAPIAPVLSSVDLAICHMEVPIGRPGAQYGGVGSSNGYAELSAPYESAFDLRAAGIDRCATASNHSMDNGLNGIAETLDALDAAGLGHSGTGRWEADNDTPIVNINGIRVAHLAFTAASNQPTNTPSWVLRLTRDPAQIIALAARARARGADVVIVNFHSFNELSSGPAASDTNTLIPVALSGLVDLIFVTGGHVPLTSTRVGGVPVFWGLGNLVSGMGVAGRGKFSDLRTLDGEIALANIRETTPGTFTVTTATRLICQDPSSRVVYPALVGYPIPPAARPAVDACIGRSGRYDRTVG